MFENVLLNGENKKVNRKAGVLMVFFQDVQLGIMKKQAYNEREKCQRKKKVKERRKERRKV